MLIAYNVHHRHTYTLPLFVEICGDFFALKIVLKKPTKLLNLLLTVSCAAPSPSMEQRQCSLSGPLLELAAVPYCIFNNQVQ